MANNEHVNWLLNGTDSWNKRRDQEDFTPDLSGHDFGNACLRGTNLSSAKLEGADLSRANLAGANLSRAEPWKAILFDPGHDVPEEQDKKTISVADLIGTCRELKNHHPDCVQYFRGEGRTTDDKGKPRKLEPSLMRNSGLRAKEGDMLLDLLTRRPEDFEPARSAMSQWILAQHHGLPTRLLDVTRNPLVALFNACEKHPDALGRVHVFSVPKTLIKPFTSDAIRVIANFAKLPRDEQDLLLGKPGPDALRGHSRVMQQLYHSIRQERPAFEGRIDPKDFYRVFVVEPQQSFPRIRAQSGAFLVSAFHERFERKKILKWNDRTPVYGHRQLKVAAEHKSSIKDELRLMNVTRETLFPELDAAATAVKVAYSQ